MSLSDFQFSFEDDKKLITVEGMLKDYKSRVINSGGKILYVCEFSILVFDCNDENAEKIISKTLPFISFTTSLPFPETLPEEYYAKIEALKSEVFQEEEKKILAKKIKLYH